MGQCQRATLTTPSGSRVPENQGQTHLASAPKFLLFRRFVSILKILRSFNNPSRQSSGSARCGSRSTSLFASAIRLSPLLVQPPDHRVFLDWLNPSSTPASAWIAMVQLGVIRPPRDP